MKTSPQKAIRINCKECIYDPLAGGNWLEQVEACAITQCPFYDHRPLTGKTKRLRRENELALLTPAEREIAANLSMKRQQILLDFRSKKESRP